MVLQGTKEEPRIVFLYESVSKGLWLGMIGYLKGSEIRCLPCVLTAGSQLAR